MRLRPGQPLGFSLLLGWRAQWAPPAVKLRLAFVAGLSEQRFPVSRVEALRPLEKRLCALLAPLFG